MSVKYHILHLQVLIVPQMTYSIQSCSNKYSITFNYTILCQMVSGYTSSH